MNMTEEMHQAIVVRIWCNCNLKLSRNPHTTIEKLTKAPGPAALPRVSLQAACPSF